MLGNNFTYASHSLSEYDMRIYDPESEQQFVGREIDKSEISSIRPIPNHYSTHYSGALILNFLIIKDDGTELSQNERLMSGDDINTIRAWLESPKTPTLLSVEPLVDDDESPGDDDANTVNYYGLFTDIQPFIVAQQCYGLHLTFTCNAPYGFSDVVEKTYTLGTVNLLCEDSTNLLDESDNIIIAEDGYSTSTFVNNSAEHNEYLKPIVTITSQSTFGANNSIQIKNITDNNKTMVLSLPQGKSSIIVDCQKKKITDGNGDPLSLYDVGLTAPLSDDYNFISSELYAFYWLRLLYGTNNLSFACPGGTNVAQVKISVREIIKSGGF